MEIPDNLLYITAGYLIYQLLGYANTINWKTGKAAFDQVDKSKILRTVIATILTAAFSIMYGVNFETASSLLPPELVTIATSFAIGFVDQILKLLYNIGRRKA